MHNIGIFNRAVRAVAACCGLLAGFGGIEHGYFEILQGSVRPSGLMIASMGPPCNPAEVWHACEPAMTVLPDLRATGIIALVLGAITFVWSGWFVQRRRGAAVLVVLSVALLLFGGGIFPPFIGLVGGISGLWMRRPLRRGDSYLTRVLSVTWPWAFVTLFVWLFAQFIVGHFFNDFLLQSGFTIPILILGLLALSIFGAFAHDASAA